MAIPLADLPAFPFCARLGANTQELMNLAEPLDTDLLLLWGRAGA